MENENKSFGVELILEKFSNGKEMYNTNPLFHQIVHMLLGNQDPLKIIEFVVLAHDLQTKTLVECMNKKPYPITVLLDLNISDKDIQSFVKDDNQTDNMVDYLKHFIEFLALNQKKYTKIEKK